MNYFISDLCGSYDFYKKVVDALNMNKNDKLWVIGCSIDGGFNPQDAVTLVNEIYKNKQVELIVGLHEFSHIMKYYAPSKEEKEPWDKQLYEDLYPSGAPLDIYLKSLPEEKYKQFIEQLCQFDLTGCAKIADDLLCYICSGSPQYYSEKCEDLWQIATLNCPPKFDKSYKKEILSDPKTAPFVNNPMTFLQNDEPLIITCYYKPSFIAKNNSQNDIVCVNRILSVSCENNQTPRVFGIDAAGYFEITIL